MNNKKVDSKLVKHIREEYEDMDTVSKIFISQKGILCDIFILINDNNRDIVYTLLSKEKHLRKTLLGYELVFEYKDIIFTNVKIELHDTVRIL